MIIAFLLHKRSWRISVPTLPYGTGLKILRQYNIEYLFSTPDLENNHPGTKNEEAI
jgi:hypothetical protein